MKGISGAAVGILAASLLILFVAQSNITGNATDLQFDEIKITSAEHIGGDKTFIADIYDQVKERDGIWSGQIRSAEYIRVVFDKKLLPSSDITIYARNRQGSNTTIEIYYFNGSKKITEFPIIRNEGYYKVYLTGMEGSSDTFDLKIKNLDSNPSAYLEFDHIVDPVQTVINSTFGSTLDSWGSAGSVDAACEAASTDAAPVSWAYDSAVGNPVGSGKFQILGDKTDDYKNISYYSNWTGTELNNGITEADNANISMDFYLDAQAQVGTTKVEKAISCVELLGTFCGTANRRLYLCMNLKGTVTGWCSADANQKYLVVQDNTGLTTGAWYSIASKRILEYAQDANAWGASCTTYNVTKTGITNKIHVGSTTADVGFTTNHDNIVITTGTADVTAPLITIAGPLPQTYYTSSIDFNASSNEALSSCVFTFGNFEFNYTMTLNSTSTGAGYTNSSMQGGTWTAKFWCNDTSNNINNTEQVTFTVDLINFTMKLPDNSETKSNFTGNKTNNVEYNASTGQDKNVSGCVTGGGNCQTALVGIFRFNNTGEVTLKWTALLNQSLPASITFWATNSSSPTEYVIPVNNSNAATLNGSITVNAEEEMWFWANFTDAVVADAIVLKIYLNGTST